MGIILIVLGIIIQRAVYKSNLTPENPNFEFENMNKYSWLIMNPSLRAILNVGSWILIIAGVVTMFG